MNANAMIEIAAKRVSAYVWHRQWQIAQLRKQGLDKIADLAERDLARRLGNG
jgi:hypothetical protein